MKKELTMPKLRPDMEKGILVAWLKETGEAIMKGEPVFEVETAKVVNQIESEHAGIMGRRFVEEGDEVAVGELIAVVE